MGLLRLWLALCVVATHGGSPGFRFMAGADAVCVFFVLAGFFGAFMLETRYRSRYRVFYLNRLLRVWPFYLLVLAATTAFIAYAYQQGAQFGPAKNLPHLSRLPGTGVIAYWAFSQIFILGQDLNHFLSFPPEGGALFWSCGSIYAPNLAFMAILSPAWSLAVEEYFYLLAPWFHRASNWLAAALFGFWLLAYDKLYATCALLPKQLPLFALMPFFGGILAYRFYARNQASWLTHPTLRWAVPLAYGLFIVSAGYSDPGVSVELALTALALPWIFRLSRDLAWDRWIGDLSYPLYLMHLPVLWVVAWKAPTWGPWLGMLSALVAAMVAAWAVERPLRALRARLMEQ